MKPKKSPLVLASTGENKMRLMRRIFWISLLTLVVVTSVWVYLKLHQPNVFPIAKVQVEGDYPHLNQHF